ncbi:MAG: aldehyde dehydrogenase family protein, partial [Ktedonobacterales bacterium]
VNLALDVARKIKAGTIWINSTNVFDAAAGFGGYRESGYGREGGREGLYEYLRPAGEAAHADHTNETAGPAANGNGHKRAQRSASIATSQRATNGVAHPRPDTNGDALDGDEEVDSSWFPPIDRTPKLFIGGKQARPDSGYSRVVYGVRGERLGEVGEGNRKDIRNAVEAAHAAEAGWSGATAHNRAQILYYIAENLSVRASEFAARIAAMTGREVADAEREVERSIERLFTYGAWADKYDGQIHTTPIRGMTLAVPEPIGALGLICPEEYPLLGFVSLVAPAIAMGNTVVAVPSERHPLSATDLYAVLETSDVPVGVVNIVTGPRATLAKVLAEHDDVDAVWSFGPREEARAVEAASIGNMKRTWVSDGQPRAWMSREQGEGQEFLREATQVKNIWVPVGE